jgi:CyaY protein
MPQETGSNELSDSDFHALATGVLSGIESTLDQWLQADRIDIDASRTGGLLEMRFPNGGVIVINLQPPLHELWLAARSGGFHFQHREGRWVDTRSGEDFFDVLSRCASEQAGITLQFVAALG